MFFTIYSYVNLIKSEHISMSIAESIFGKELYDQWTFNSFHLPWSTPVSILRIIFSDIDQITGELHKNGEPNIYFAFSLFGMEPITYLDRYKGRSGQIILNNAYQTDKNIITKNLSEFIRSRIDKVSIVEQSLQPDKIYNYIRQLRQDNKPYWIYLDFDLAIRFRQDFPELDDMFDPDIYLSKITENIDDNIYICLKTSSKTTSDKILEKIEYLHQTYMQLDYKVNVFTGVKTSTLIDTPKNTPTQVFYFHYIYKNS